MGVMAAIVDPKDRLLVLEHEGSDKAPDGAYGPLGETSRIKRAADEIFVESTEQTLGRGVQEELNKVPSDLKLRSKKIGAWMIYNWPVGRSYEGQYAFAVAPVVHIDATEGERLIEEFEPTDEVRRISFRTMDEIKSKENVRPGTHGWTEKIRESGLVEAKRDLQPLLFEEPPLVDGVDIKFDKIEI